MLGEIEGRGRRSDDAVRGVDAPLDRMPHGLHARRHFLHDLVAGVTVGLVALPLAMAFAISSGVTPQAGIYTAIVAGFLVSALGGSRSQIGGPDRRLRRHRRRHRRQVRRLRPALVCMMAGVMLIVMGLTGLGTAVRFIPRPVTIGFTNGIAVLIASTQIKDFFGLATPAGAQRVPAAHGDAARATQARSAGRPSRLPPASLAVILFWPRVTRRVPGSIVALLLATMAAAVVAACRSKRSAASSAAFPRDCRTFAAALSGRLNSAAAAVGLHGRDAGGDRKPAVGGRRRQHERRPPQARRGTGGPGRGEHRVAAVRRHPGHRRHRPHGHQHPLRRADARRRHRSRADAAGDSLVAAPLARFIPLATLAAVLFVVAYNMGEWREIGTILRLSKTDIAVWVATFALTVLRRSDGRGRGRHGAGRAALHLPDRRDDDRGGGHAGVSGGRARRTSCRTRTFPRT